ncbi:aldo/keto reductase [Paenibacillus septentrionalis]|uniref:Aldo/keto reductase n=1 Tax=Paenibacillus septentrionalis TaxID=429342 RepID=A0ABW1V260_9BACL
MHYMSIAGCSKPISTVIKGTDYLQHATYELNKEQLDQYVAIGGNTIDSAHVYTGGESEAVLGRYMEERGNRSELVVLTKGGISSLQRSVLHQELTTSLERLRTDYIDLYALHRDDASLTVGEIIDMMNEYIAAGTIHAIGTSNWTPERILAANEYAAQQGLVGFTFNSPNLSLAKPKEAFWSGVLHVDEEMARMHEVTKLPCLSWSPLARGFFSGRFTPNEVTDRDIERVYYSDENWSRYERAKQLAEQKDVTLPEIALAYVANQSYPTAIIAGARTMEELQSCVRATNLVLTEEEIAWLEQG